PTPRPAEPNRVQRAEGSVVRSKRGREAEARPESEAERIEELSSQMDALRSQADPAQPASDMQADRRPDPVQRRAAPEAAAPPAAAAEPQPEADAGAPFNKANAPLDWSKLVRAANFPDSEDDRETLQAIYAVLSDAHAASMLQHAEDALSALADINLFMDELEPVHAPSSLWQSYIENGDAPNVLELGGVRDPDALMDAEELIEERDGFEETVEKLISAYEALLEKLFKSGQDPALAVRLADTRTGRAYMLLARASRHFGA
ncbi:MAG: hypothetical protein AAFV62_02190, partial [Pseudomonadota bacterium]